MLAFGELLLAALSRISQLATVVGTIYSLLSGLTPNPQTGLVIDETDLILSDILDPSFGLPELHTQLTNLALQVSSAESAILTAITDLTNGVTPVSLPPTAPIGFLAGDYGDIANSVWNDTVSGLAYPAQTYLRSAAIGMDQFEQVGTFVPAVPYFWLIGLQSELFQSIAYVFPAFDPSDILVGESFIACLNRQNPTNDGVFWFEGAGGHVQVSFNSPHVTNWVTRIDEPHFLELRRLAVAGSQAINPPVWPGFGLVTLGTPTAISSQFSIVGPMSGVIVEISAVSVSKVSLAYDTALAYRNIGGLSFYDDNGNQEEFQNLSFTSQVYCPRFMSVAAGVRFRVDPAVAGTVTPWVTDTF